MISNIILPKKIGSYYLFKEKVIAIDIGKTSIYATVTLLKGKNRIILDFIEQEIELNNNFNNENSEKIINALKLLKLKLPKHDRLIGVLSSSWVVFKEISIPFLDRNKVKMVIPFEVESMLPFTLDQSSLDSIITKEDKTEKMTESLVAAVKNEYIDQFIDYFEKAELKLDKITVDIFDLYGLYELTKYNNKTNTVIIDINLNTMYLAIIIENQLKYIRIIPKGLINAVKKISNELSIDANNIINQLINFGIYDQNYEQVISNALSELFEELKFSILSYKDKLNIEQEIKLALLTGLASEINGIESIANKILNIEIKTLQASDVIHYKEISSKIKSVQNSFLPSIASSIEPEITQDFNLYKEIQEFKDNQLILKQGITLITMLILALSSFSIYSYLRVRSIKNNTHQLLDYASTELNSNFKRLPSPTQEIEDSPISTQISDLNSKAASELRRQKTAWDLLSIKSRYSILNYLAKLSKCLKPGIINMQLNTLSIKNNKILIYGSVPGFEELNKLQNQFNTCLLKPQNSITKQSPNFTRDPIIIDISDMKE